MYSNIGTAGNCIISLGVRFSAISGRFKLVDDIFMYVPLTLKKGDVEYLLCLSRFSRNNFVRTHFLLECLDHLIWVLGMFIYTIYVFGAI